MHTHVYIIFLSIQSLLFDLCGFHCVKVIQNPFSFSFRLPQRPLTEPLAEHLQGLRLGLAMTVCHSFEYIFLNFSLVVFSLRRFVVVVNFECLPEE